MAFLSASGAVVPASDTSKTWTSADGRPGGVGMIFVDSAGNEYLMCKNIDSAAFAAADLVRQSGTTNAELKLHVTDDGNEAGPFYIAVSAIPASGYGFVLHRGFGSVNFDHTGTNVAVGDNLVASDSTAKKVELRSTATADLAQEIIAVAYSSSSVDAAITVYLRP